MRFGLREAPVTFFAHEPAASDDRRLSDLSRSSATSRNPHQVLPPTKIDGVNAKQLLHDWANSQFQGYFRTLVLNRMVDDIAAATYILKKAKYSSNAFAGLGRGILRWHWGNTEAVGLLPRSLPAPFLESGSSAVDASVLALGVFSREQREDDSDNSVRKRVEEQFAMDGIRRWIFHGRSSTGRGKYDVFAIQGLAEAPGLPDRSAKILLAKIAKYAQKDDKLVVVSERACISSDGTDLTEYYERLGFEKVQMTDGNTIWGHELVYMGTSSAPADKWLEEQHNMVRLNPWKGVE